jgi:hypothetical protein
MLSLRRQANRTAVIEFFTTGGPRLFVPKEGNQGAPAHIRTAWRYTIRVMHCNQLAREEIDACHVAAPNRDLAANIAGSNCGSDHK